MRRAAPASNPPTFVTAATSASPAVGYLSLHLEQQKALVEGAFAPLTDNLVMPMQSSARKGN